MLFLGDKVKVLTKASCYVSDEFRSEEYPIGTIGYVVYIRYRYENTPNYYCQYKITLEKHFTGINDLRHLYRDTDLDLSVETS